MRGVLVLQEMLLSAADTVSMAAEQQPGANKIHAGACSR